ncbi:MAG: hypothetical protein SPD93_05655 [Lachnospiraceae bacterium]|nr:hypothetical protein [Lachnospiraceae bacterium]
MKIQIDNNCYVDADGNGVCDNRTDKAACPQDGTGEKKGNGHQAQDKEYKDTVNSGVSDDGTFEAENLQDRTGKMNGSGNRVQENRNTDNGGIDESSTNNTSCQQDDMDRERGSGKEVQRGREESTGITGKNKKRACNFYILCYSSCRTNANRQLSSGHREEVLL